MAAKNALATELGVGAGGGMLRLGAAEGEPRSEAVGGTLAAIWTATMLCRAKTRTWALTCRLALTRRLCGIR